MVGNVVYDFLWKMQHKYMSTDIWGGGHYEVIKYRVVDITSHLKLKHALSIEICYFQLLPPPPCTKHMYAMQDANCHFFAMNIFLLRTIKRKSEKARFSTINV